MGWDGYLWVVGGMEHLANRDKEVGDLTKCENVHKIRRQMLMMKINPPTLGDITFRCIDANPRLPQKLKMILSS